MDPRFRMGMTILLFAALPARAAAPPVFMDEMTWMEIREHIKAGATTAIIPTGGTGQEGPQMVEGIRITSSIALCGGREIARELGDNCAEQPPGDAVCAGRGLHQPGGRTYAVSRYAFVTSPARLLPPVLEDLARSLKQHGFKRICFIGESGGAQPIQQQVADKLNDE